MSCDTTAICTLGRPGGSCGLAIKVGKFLIKLACCRSIDDESSTMNRMSTLGLIDGFTAPRHRFGSAPPAPPPSGVPSPPPHAAPVITSTPNPQHTIRMRASYASAAALVSLLLVAPPTHAN